MGRSDVRTPSQDRAIKTRAALVAAAQQEFSSHGYAAATARSIAEAAGVATGSFYQYFQDKDRILHELARARLERVGAEVAKHVDLESIQGRGDRSEVAAIARESLRALVEVVVAYHREDVGLHAVLTERRHADVELDRMTTLAERALMAHVARILRAVGHDGDVDALAFTLFAMVEGTVHAHVLGTPLVDDARITAALVHALVRLVLR